MKPHEPHTITKWCCTYHELEACGMLRSWECDKEYCTETATKSHENPFEVVCEKHHKSEPPKEERSTCNCITEGVAMYKGRLVKTGSINVQKCKFCIEIMDPIIIPTLTEPPKEQ